MLFYAGKTVGDQWKAFFKKNWKEQQKKSMKHQYENVDRLSCNYHMVILPNMATILIRYLHDWLSAISLQITQNMPFIKVFLEWSKSKLNVTCSWIWNENSVKKTFIGHD